MCFRMLTKFKTKSLFFELLHLDIRQILGFFTFFENKRKNKNENIYSFQRIFKLFTINSIVILNSR